MESAEVMIVGMYTTLDNAKMALRNTIGVYEPGINNTVTSKLGVGWINAYEPDKPLINPHNMKCNQLHSSVNLFDDDV